MIKERYKLIVGSLVSEFNTEVDKAINDGWNPTRKKLIVKLTPGGLKYIKEFAKTEITEKI